MISALISEISGMVDLKIEFLFSCQVILQDCLQLGSGCKSFRNLRYKDYFPLGSLEKSSLLDLRISNKKKSLLTFFPESLTLPIFFDLTDDSRNKGTISKIRTIYIEWTQDHYIYSKVL